MGCGEESVHLSLKQIFCGIEMPFLLSICEPTALGTAQSTEGDSLLCNEDSQFFHKP